MSAYLVMQRLRTLAPWSLALLALGWAASRDGLLAAAPIAAGLLALASLAVVVAVVLAVVVAVVVAVVRRRRGRPARQADPQAVLAAERRRTLARSLAAARRHHPSHTWLCLGLPGHGKSAVLRGAGPLQPLGEPAAAPALQLHLLADTRELVLEHPGVACELTPLRALRRRQPLDGVLVVLGLPELLTCDPTQLAAALRPQLSTALATLAVDVPIFLICSKLDRLAGHAELTGDEREPWGFELGDRSELPARLQAWSQWALARRLTRLASEPVPDRRARIFTFGAQFSRACDRLARLTDALFSPHPGAALRLRGVYFVAARPTAAPGDALLAELAAELHTRVRAVEVDPVGEPPATDLRPLFTALRRRSGEATRSPGRRRAAQRRAHGLAGLLALVAVALAVTALGAAHRTHDRLQSLADLSATLGATDPTPSLMALRAELDTWSATSVRRLYSPALREPLLAAYRRTARERLLVPIWRDLEAALARDASHDQLRAYLLLTGCDRARSDMSPEPCLTDREQTDWLLAELPRLAASDTPAELTLLLGTLLAHATAEDLRFTRDHGLVERTRARLRGLDDDEAVVLAALAAGDSACEPLTLRALTHAEQLVGAGELPCSFTRRGWPVVHTQLLRAAEHRDGWVLGRPARERADAGRLARLRGRYEALHIAAWTEFLAGVRVRRPVDLADAARLLAELTGDERPLTRIFAALERHTRGLQHAGGTPSLTHLLQGLDHPEHSAAIVRAFAPLLAFTLGAPDRQAGLDRYHARLAELRDALEAARRDPADLPALQTQLDLASTDTHALLQHADLRRFRALLSGLLLPPLTALQSALRDQDKLALTAAYCGEIDAPLRRMISRYPFAAAAHDELGLAEFTEFFHPGTGAVRKFRDERLAALIAVHGREISARPTARSDEHPLAPGVLDLLMQAADLGALAFPGGRLGLDLEFDLHCNADVGRVHLSVDGASHSYACGPDHRARMRWPGAGEPGASLELVGRDGRREIVPGAGPWGLWRLLEKDDLVSPPRDRSRPRLVFRLDLRASRLGTLDLAITPPRTHGATLLFGDPTDPDAPLLAPLRAPELLDPPATLFTGLPTCAALGTR